MPLYIHITFFYNCALWCTNILIDQENEKMKEKTIYLHLKTACILKISLKQSDVSFFNSYEDVNLNKKQLYLIMFTHKFRYFWDVTVDNKKKMIVLWGRKANNYKMLWIAVIKYLCTEQRTFSLTNMGIAGLREEQNVFFPLSP